MTTRSPSPLQATSSHAGWIRVTSLSTALFLLLSFAAFSGFKDALRGDNIISASEATGLRPSSLQGHSHDDDVIHSASDDGTYHHHHYQHYHQRVESFSENETTSPSPSSSSSYFVFLQKFPLESTFRMIFHTEVVVCPRDAFSDDLSFLDTLDDLASSLSPPEAATGNEEEIMSTHPMIHQRRNPPQPRGKHFAQVPKSQWSSQSNPRCTQLGYGGSSCTDRCCSVPHRGTNYPLDSKQAVIGNAMGEYKELYLYGVSDVDEGGLSGEDAYRAVCRRDGDDDDDDGDDDTLPKCVSDWAGTDYNPLTNNCNTFTSTVLKCVFGLSDDKPDLGVSDLVTVECPEERRSDGGSGNGWDLVKQCLVPDRQAERGGLHGPSDAGKSELLDLQR